jgi:hypothetical protein
MAKFPRNCFAKKGPTVVKILGNQKILSKYSRNRKEPGDFRENLLENGISQKNSKNDTKENFKKFRQSERNFVLSRKCNKTFSFQPRWEVYRFQRQQKHCSMILKEWTSISHLTQYVEHNNKIATDFHMVSCVIDFYMKQQGLRKPLHAFSRSML